MSLTGGVHLPVNLPLTGSIRSYKRLAKGDPFGVTSRVTRPTSPATIASKTLEVPLGGDFGNVLRIAPLSWSNVSTLVDVASAPSLPLRSISNPKICPALLERIFPSPTAWRTDRNAGREIDRSGV